MATPAGSRKPAAGAPAAIRQAGTVRPPASAPTAGPQAPDAHPLPAAPRIGAEALVGQVIGGCRILSLIGRGAMGAVYKANQTSLDRMVALKTIRQDFCTEENFLQRFKQEARTVGRFNTPHVVQIHEVGFDQGLHYIVMEYVGGGNLRTYIEGKPRKRLPVGDVLRFMRQAAEGLLEAEKLQVVHRDIKPENLLLDTSGRLKIADFGISKMLGGDVQMTTSTTLLGTPLYMSPEQAQGRRLDHRSDLYSLGATFFHMLTGIPPVKGDSVYDIIQRKGEIEFLSPKKIVLDGSIPDPISTLIEKMTFLDPDDRYPTFQTLLDDIGQIERGQGLEAPPRGRRRKRKGVSWLRVAAAVLVLCGLGYGGFLGFPKLQELGYFGGKSNLVEKVPPKDPPPERKKSDQNHSQNTGNGSTDLVQPPPFDPEQIRAELGQLKTTLRRGPGDHIRREATNLLQKIPTAAADGGALRADIEALIKDNELGLHILNGLPSKNSEIAEMNLSLPFSGLESTWKGIHTFFEVKEASGPEIQDWLRAKIDEQFQKVEMKVKAAVEQHFQNLEKQAEKLRKREITPRNLEILVARLEEGKSALGSVFPERSETWKSLIPDQRVESFRALLRQMRELEEKTANLDAAIAQVKKEVEEIRSVETWEAGNQKIRQEIARLEGTLDEMKDLLHVDERKGSLQGALRRLDDWKDHVFQFQKTLELVTPKNLKDAELMVQELLTRA